MNKDEWSLSIASHSAKKKIQNVHKQHYFGGLDQPSIRPLLTSDPTLMQSKKLVSYSTCWGHIFYSDIYFLCRLNPDMYVFSFYRDPWLTVIPARVWMCSSVQFDCPPLLCLMSICLCANVSWLLDISGPGGLNDSEFELTVCHCHNIKATIRQTDTSVPFSLPPTLWHAWVFMFLLSCPDLSALSMIIPLSNCSRRGGGTPQSGEVTAHRSKNMMTVGHVLFNINN